MKTPTKSDWLIPAGLIALALIPMVAGTFRLLELASPAEITPANARFVAAPVPVVTHIVSSAIFCVLGAFQFSPGWRKRHPRSHRFAGWLLVPLGFAAALSALWMTQFYPNGRLTGEAPADYDGPLLYWIRLFFGVVMVASLALASWAIKRRDFRQHGAWMRRAYAIGLGAGTQVFTHLPWFLMPDLRGELSRALMIAAGWVVNLAVVEWLIARSAGPRSPATAGAPAALRA
jgi:uncharacterized membrane protein